MNHAHGSPHSNGSNTTLTTTGSASPSASMRSTRHERVKISVSYPSSDNISSQHLSPSPTAPVSYSVHYSANGKERVTSSLCRTISRNSERGTESSRDNEHCTENLLRVHSGRFGRRSRRSGSCDSGGDRDPRDVSPIPGGNEDPNKMKGMSKKMGKRNIKAQVKRFRMETKAAKTLGIIVGGFIFCWLPFFTMYLIRAFCEDCIPPLLFSILFWLGYCNSAINPLIYALFSKDFRFAFKRIICRCFCKNSEMPLSRRGSDNSQHQGRQFRSASYNLHQPGNSLGEDSDPTVDASDSR